MDHNQGKAEWKMAMNEYGDMTKEEFKKLKLGFNPPPNYEYTNTTTDITDILRIQVSDDEEFDWRRRGAVNPVSNQGKCRLS